MSIPPRPASIPLERGPFAFEGAYNVPTPSLAD